MLPARVNSISYVAQCFTISTAYSLTSSYFFVGEMSMSGSRVLPCS